MTEQLTHTYTHTHTHHGRQSITTESRLSSPTKGRLLVISTGLLASQEVETKKLPPHTLLLLYFLDPVISNNTRLFIV